MMSEENGADGVEKEDSRKKSETSGLISALVEVLILAVLALAFCWDRGLSAKVSGVLGIFDRPPATELDVSGVNSSMCF